MKQVLMLLTFAFGFQLNAQTHHIGLNFGVNQLLSIDEGPPFGDNSPWESTLGIGYELSYHYVFRNGLSVGLDIGYISPNFKDYEGSTFIEQLNEEVVADRVLILSYISYDALVAYKWDLSSRYSIQVNTGPSIYYEDREKSYVEGFEETLIIRDFEYAEKRFNYGVSLGLKQSYTVYQDWNYRINLTATLRNSYIFDYLHRNNSIDRILPQAYLGVELELGRRRP